MTAFKKIKKNKGVKGDPKLSEELILDICKYIQRGTFIETAVVMCNISKSTFYRWMKESHLDSASRTKKGKLLIQFRNAVAKAQEEATVRDVINIDKCAMGRRPEYDRYPKGTILPARDEKGNIQFDKSGEIVYIDVSGQIITDYKGKPIVADQGAPPDWKASAWRLEKRVPKDWGNNPLAERFDPQEKEETEDGKEVFRIEFVDSEADMEAMERLTGKIVE